jgi:hypothetical protein
VNRRESDVNSFKTCTSKATLRLKDAPPVNTLKDFKDSKPFVCMYTNADSLLNKRNELEAMVEIHKPAIIGIVEVKPKNYRFSVQECEVSLPGYELFHNLDQDGRGICLHIQGDLKPAPSAIKSDFQEAVFVDCKVSQVETLTVGLVYRSPNSSDDNEKLNTTMVKIAESKPNHLIILGDFNFPEIDWQEEKCTASANHPATKFLKATRDAFLTQHQTTPTRFRQGQ